VRTRDVKEPVGGLSNIFNERKELDVALVQGLILTAEGKNATECFRWSVGIIRFAGNPETHLWCGKFATCGKGLPEWSCTGVGNCIVGQAHDTSVGAI
jgi:hypothetical protein